MSSSKKYTVGEMIKQLSLQDPKAEIVLVIDKYTAIASSMKLRIVSLDSGLDNLCEIRGFVNEDDPQAEWQDWEKK
jgi:hypothetical protein